MKSKLGFNVFLKKILFKPDLNKNLSKSISDKGSLAHILLLH